ncbi:hypothetical protein [Gordonia polyisoprenivorans]|uniref:hypothetical protein n=1 Tax=Gordonia polyisoprenivorans TaxID=84595 RepID=UPI001AD60A2C|nr:hypothetical protein [Gordonia polyisoprenivorans]QTI69305.1 hypothetical protein J6U32_01320 [Gordonia polyisoprenivorans]
MATDITASEKTAQQDSSQPDSVTETEPTAKAAVSVPKNSPLGKKRTKAAAVTTVAQSAAQPADTETKDTEPDDPQQDSASAPAAGRTPASERRRVLPWITGVLAVLLVAAIALAGYFGYEAFSGNDSDGAVTAQMRTQATDTARDYAIKLSSFDYRDLNKNRDAIASMSTENFAAKYSEMVSALTQIVTDGKGEATAEVPHAAVENIDAGTATVLLFVNQKATNVVAPDGKNQPYRMLVTLKRSGDHWLVDNVETI